jgi:DHA1 family tetracycline resistance protein-like MFS transporter
MKQAHLDPTLITVFSIVVIDLIGFGIILPLLPIYAQSYGASPFTIGLLAISYSIAQLVFNPVWGGLSDKSGRRPILLLSLAGAAAFYVLFGAADSLLLLFVARIGAGIFAANISTAMAVIADVTTHENRTKGMGLIGMAFAIGFIIGPALGGILSRYSYSAAGYGAAVLSAIALLLAIFKLPETKADRSESIARRGFLRPIVDALRTPQLSIPLWVHFLSIMAFSSMQMTFPLFTMSAFGFDVKENGYVFAFVGVIAMVFQGGLIGRLANKFGEGPIATVGIVIAMLGFFILPLSENVTSLVLVMAVLGIGTGLNTPTLTSLISISASDEDQGKIIGASRSVATLARILGPLWGGWIYGFRGPLWTYWSAGMVMVAALAVCIRLWSIRPGKLVAEPG